MGGYEMIATVLLYLLLLRTLDGPRMNPIRAATIFIAGSAAMVIAFAVLENAMRSASHFNSVIAFQDVFVLAVQWLATIGIFYKAEEAGDEYLSYAFWGGLGLAIIFYGVPTLVHALFALLL